MRLTKACEDAIAQYVEDLFDHKPMIADVIAKLPFLDLSDFKYLVEFRLTNALGAWMWFHQTKPAWSPELPFSAASRLVLRETPNRRLILVGCFGYSLNFTGWDYRHHPDFRSYCRAVMAFPDTPGALRNDPGLRREFPPQRLLPADGLAFLPLNGDPHVLNG